MGLLFVCTNIFLRSASEQSVATEQKRITPPSAGIKLPTAELCLHHFVSLAGRRPGETPYSALKARKKLE